jgi:hypothetical protein
MSIATLKKKSGAMNARLSANSSLGFSLNNPRRNIGYIGQTGLSKHYNGGFMKGAVIKGHGGCCNTYRIANVPSPFIEQITEPPSVITSKPSVKTNTGLLSTKYRWVKRPQPYSTTKKFIDKSISQDMLTQYLKKRAINQANTCNTNKVVETAVDAKGCPVKCFIKEEQYKPVMSSSEYILKRLVFKCQELDNIQFSKNAMGTPFGCASARITTDSNQIS